MKILVVEDEHKIANAVKKGLEHEGLVVDVAYDGEDGYDMAVGESYDVVVLDVMLPGMDGVTICKKLRAEKIQTPVLLLTAKGDLDDRVNGLNTGADDYLVKPFAFAELVARVKALSRRSDGNREITIKIADLELNTVTHEVKRNSEVIKLSFKEYALLEYLMRRKNAVVTKDQILQNVWDYDADVLPNIVEVYIRHLRLKIDKSTNEPLIQTIRGFGYSLREN